MTSAVRASILLCVTLFLTGAAPKAMPKPPEVDLCEGAAQCRPTTRDEQLMLLAYVKRLEDTVPTPASLHTAEATTANLLHARIGRATTRIHPLQTCHTRGSGCFPEQLFVERVLEERNDAGEAIGGKVSIRIDVHPNDTSFCHERRGEVLGRNPHGLMRLLETEETLEVVVVGGRDQCAETVAANAKASPDAKVKARGEATPVKLSTGTLTAILTIRGPAHLVGAVVDELQPKEFIALARTLDE